jgi:1-pyrroline-5-carboxylate dehydrogenase
MYLNAGKRASKSYTLNSPERAAVLAAYTEMWDSKIDVLFTSATTSGALEIQKRQCQLRDPEHIIWHYHLAEKIS